MGNDYSLPEVKDVFVPNTETTSTIFSNIFIIPPFQRFFSWDKEHIVKLLEDLYQCINPSKLRIDSEYSSIYCFLGSVIAVKVTDRSSFEFFNEKQDSTVPLYSIIDGQQRLTTIQLIATVLYERLDYLVSQIQSYKDKHVDEKDEISSGIIEEVLKDIDALQDDLKNICTFECQYKKQYSKTKIRIPRLLRVPEDYFDQRDSTKEYTSVVGQYFNNFSELYFNSRSDSEDTVKLDNCVFKNYKSKVLSSITDLNEDKKEQLSDLKNAIHWIEEFIVKYYSSAEDIRDKHNEDDSDFVSFGLSREQIYKIYTSKEFYVQNQFLNKLKDLSKEAFVMVLKEHNNLLQITLEISIFTKFFLENLAFTFVYTPNDDYAFSMFDSLNTTGEVLTAYETFKAKVVSRTENYITSDIKKIFDEIDSFLNNKKQKKSLTDNLLISFARESRKEVGKNLNNQRAFLDDLLLTSGSTQEKKFSIVEELYVAMLFWKNIWQFDFSEENPCVSFELVSISSGVKKQIKFDAFTSLCVALFVKVDHPVVAAVIIRFLSYCYRNINDKSYATDLDNLKKIIRICAVFSTIYRIAIGTTKGIDSVYKSLFQKQKTKLDIPNISWLDSTKSTSTELLRNIKQRLCDELKLKEMNTLTLWQNKGKLINSYADCKEFSIFVLLCYWSLEQDHNIEISKFSLREELIRFLINDPDKTVEHIAPQHPASNNQPTSWDRSIYSPTHMEGNLGNLLLVDRGVNSFIGNAEPLEKLALYTFFAMKAEARNVEEFYTNFELIKGKFDLSNCKEIEQQFLINHFTIDELKKWNIESVKRRFDIITSSVWNLFSDILF